MQHLFTDEGWRALRALMARRPLLAFDFDGTLAPIVDRPAAARVPQPVADRLHSLAQRLPVAIISGRNAADVRARLHFKPWRLIGCHGAEQSEGDPAEDAHVAALAPVRARLRAAAADLHAAGVMIEDKAASLALHYRLAPHRERAQQAIAALLADAGPELAVFGGKLVVNVVSATAPDKAQALVRLVEQAGAGAAFFAGDDVNDEPVFAAADPHWLTVRIGRDAEGSRAQYYIDDPVGMPRLLDAMLDALQPRNESS